MRVYIIPAFKRIFAKRETKAIMWTREINRQIKALEKSGDSVKGVSPIRDDMGKVIYWIFFTDEKKEG